MRSEGKAEIACWLGYWLVPLALVALWFVAALIFGDVVTCAGKAAEKCSVGQHIVHQFNFISGVGIFLVLISFPFYFILLIGRLAYLIIKRTRAK